MRSAAAALVLLWFASVALAGAPRTSTIDADGTVHLPEIEVPLSPYMSEQARRQFIDDFRKARGNKLSPRMPIATLRKAVDAEFFRPKLAALQARFRVRIVSQRLGGVALLIITPRAGIPMRNRNKVLINLHGGGFTLGSGAAQLIESIPIAAIGGFEVVSVDYRMAPEYRFPAASEDVARVYAALLRKFRPQDIGLYGCSAGGELTAQATAWLGKVGLPTPAAIGIFGAGAFGNWQGISTYIVPPLTGGPVVPVSQVSTPKPGRMDYISPADLNNPLVSPGASLRLLRKFPPTLIITGTRSIDMSVAVETQRQLVNAGVEADLHVWDGMTHCFIYDGNLPEAEEAYGVIVKFFNRHLGHEAVK